MDKHDESPSTIKLIASVLGLSHSTVSRALNGRPGVNNATRSRIEIEAARQGYVANRAAQMLKQRSSSVMGLVVPNIRNRFYASVARAMADAASKQARQVMLFTTDDDPRRESQSIRSLAGARARAVVIAATAHPEPETLELLNNLRTIQLLRRNAEIPGPVVEVDDALGIELATTALLQAGHRRVAYIGALAELSTGRNRLMGYRRSLDRAGVVFDDQLVALRSPDVEDGVSALGLVLSSHPTGLVVGSPELAEGVVLELVRRRVDVPRQLSLVCYGDRDWQEMVYGGLTSVVLPEDELARTALALLLAPAESVAADVLLLPKLLERASVAPPNVL